MMEIEAAKKQKEEKQVSRSREGYRSASKWVENGCEYHKRRKYNELQVQPLKKGLNHNTLTQTNMRVFTVKRKELYLNFIFILNLRRKGGN